VPWVAGEESGVLDPSAHPFEVSYDETGYGGFNNNYLKINANRCTKSEPLSFFYLQFKPVRDVGLIDLNSLVFANVDLRINQKSYEIDKMAPYNFEINTLDTVKRILSGKFYFTVTRPNDTINVTNGRFDLKYSPE
jgi:hypothetical protein